MENFGFPETFQIESKMLFNIFYFPLLMNELFPLNEIFFKTANENLKKNSFIV